MRAFQYQILLGTIPIQKFLAKCKLVDSDKCWFCKESVETIEHSFWFCPIVKTFCLQILDAIQVGVDIREHQSYKFIFGRVQQVMNHLFTLVKKYMYTRKCNEKLLSIQGF